MATGAVYGFIRMLGVIREKADIHPIVGTFDSPAPTFRHETFKEYKATRERMPEDLQEQLPYIVQILEANGIPVMMKDGYEADDIMATVARWASRQDIDCYLVTSDKDMAQLVDERIKLVPPPRAGEMSILGPQEVEEKYGVPPSRIVDFLALTGDSSDNIPGVPGVGKKRATELIKTYGSLEGVLEHAGDIPLNAVRTSLEHHGEQALLSRQLVELCFDAPVPLGPELLASNDPNPHELVRLYTELEFATLARDVKLPEVVVERDYRVVRSVSELRDVCEELTASGLFCFDLETTSLDSLTAEPVGVALSAKEGAAFYVPLGASGLSKQAVWDLLKPILENPELRKGGQNSKYDIQVLRQHGIEVRGLSFDTMIESYLLDPNLRQRNLDFLSLRYLGIKKIPTEELIGKGKNQITMDLVPVDEVGEYACEDADVSLRLHYHFAPQLKALGVEQLYRDVEIPLIDVLAAMERRGICLDVDYVKRLGKELGEQLAVLEQGIKEAAGQEFNLNSPQQLSQILFEKLEVHKELGIKRLRKTKTGYSTDASVLDSMSAHPVVAQVMEYRNLAKLKSTYVDALPRLVNPATRRIHTSFNQAVAATGRLSSSDPNLQNIPIRTEEGRKVRRAFIPAPGSVLVTADYSQIELRILAHLSKDAALQGAFEQGEDIHTETAARVFELSTDQITPEIRSRAKAINFGLIYGMGPRRLARETGITMGEATEFIERYFQRFPGVKRYTEQMLHEARTEGGVRTMLGRWRPVPDMTAHDRGRQQAAERVAVNTPIQGSAADLMKVAMLKVYDFLKRYLDEAYLLLQVHDELVLEVKSARAEELGQAVADVMEEAVPLSVPVKVDVGWGPNWLEAK
jgi:DNA polymerase-1